MANFPGGSAWALVRDISAGYYMVTERSFQPYNRAQLEKLSFELDRHLREVRSEQPALDDLPAVQNRNRRIQRLNTAGMILRSFRAKRKM